MRRRAIARACALGVVLSGFTACGGGPTESEPVRVKLPSGIALYFDQSRLQRNGRTVFIRVDNDSGEPITVERATFSSDRIPVVHWTAADDGLPDDADGKEIEVEGDLRFELPTGGCGQGSGASVELTYRVGDEDERRVSTGEATDRYGAIEFFLDRDCAQQTLAEAADLSVGEGEVEGRGATAVMRFPITLTPTGARDDVSFAGFDSTPLFSATGRWVDARLRLGPGTPTRRIALEVVPARCDAHALAEDKIGLLFGMFVRAPGLPRSSQFYVPLPEGAREQLVSYLKDRCGLP